MNRKEILASIAKDTVNITKNGEYKNNRGEIVSIEKDVEKMVKGTILYTPGETDKLLDNLSSSETFDTKISVVNMTTLEAAKKLKDEGYEKVLCLNFASAKNPGGGFLNGSVAQEESLARASSLYESLITKMKMYDYNRNFKSALYSDYMIYSPDVPVFRNDKNTLLDTPYNISFITSPAVNSGVVKEREKGAVSKIHATMKKRIEKILAVALQNEYEVLVLGAFGCGVFKNNPKDVAGYFQEILTKNEKFHGAFKKIVFAVYDSNLGTPTFYAFKNALR